MADGGRDDFQGRFQLCPPQVLNQATVGGTQLRFNQNLGNLEKSDFFKFMFVKSRGVKYHP